MVRASDATRARILDAAYGLFYREGFARVSVDAIAAASGLTKRTLYYHFTSKDALIAAVLESQHLRALETIRGWAGEAPGPPVEMVERLFVRLAEWASGPQ
jgi:AcrR family transcriptional regulator